MLAADLEATPLVPQLMFIFSPDPTGLALKTKELLSKDREVILVRAPLMTPISTPGRLPPALPAPQLKSPVALVHCKKLVVRQSVAIEEKAEPL